MNLDELFPDSEKSPLQEAPQNEYAGRELYALAKNNKVQMWKAEVLEEQTKEGWYIVRATYGFTDGAKQTKDTTVKKGTNIGKVNEKTVFEQAYIKLDQLYQDRIKKKSMVWDIKDWVAPKRPQLADTFQKRKKYLSHVKEWLIDRKLDGNRAYTYVDGSVQSKSGEPITPIKHIYDEHIVTFGKGHHKYGEIHVDGEYYIHGIPLEDITSIIKLYKKFLLIMILHITNYLRKKSYLTMKKKLLKSPTVMLLRDTKVLFYVMLMVNICTVKISVIETM